MSKINHKLIVEKLLEVCKICNQILLKNFQNLQSKDIFYKDSDREICTEFDLEIERTIKKFLSENFKKSKFISEESFDKNDETDFSKEELVFIIDPIDGTSNFVNGLEFFCISIAVMSFGEFIGGIVSAPILGKIFYGIKDIGAFLEDLKCAKTKKLIFYSDDQQNRQEKNQKKYLIACSFSFANTLRKTISFRILGSIALSISYCSNSVFDGFVCPSCKIWDFAGGIGILNSMNFPIFLKEINKKKKIFQIAVHRDIIELEKLVEFFDSN
jgi:myo-inositol-1(or 4)-monophosphatase